MTSGIRKLRELAKQARETHTYRADRASLIFTEELVRMLDEYQVSNSELARRIGTSPAYVTKILRGDTNFTLNTMVKIANALDCQLQTHLARRGFRTHWHDEGPEKKKFIVSNLTSDLNPNDFADVEYPFSTAA